MKIRIITNPNAGTMDEDTLSGMESAMERLGDTALLPTNLPGEAESLAREAVEDGCDLVIAAGGDGTINEVVNGLSRDFSRARLGIIPLGTGNDLARSLDLPSEVDAALELIAAGHTRAIDVIRTTTDYEERYFINVSACGFSGQAGRKLTDEMKQTWGPLAYLRSGLEALTELTEYRAALKLDDELLDLNLLNAIFANGRYVGGGIPVAPEAQLDDGLLDVILIPALSMVQLAALVPRILTGQHMNSDLLVFRRARKIGVQSDPPIYCNLDGEMVESGPTTFEVLHRTLEVITGHAAQGV